MHDSGIGFSRQYRTGGVPVWQGKAKDIQLAQGGFNLIQTGFAVGTIIPAGTPMVYDEATRNATVLGSGTVYANAAANAVNYPVAKNNSLKVGDNLASGATGGKAYPITAIDRTNDAYDVVTVGTTIGAVNAGDTVYNSTATGATASALPAINARLYDDAYVSSHPVSVSAVIRGTVYARRVPNSDAIEAALRSNDALIIHSQSF